MVKNGTRQYRVSLKAGKVIPGVAHIGGRPVYFRYMGQPLLYAKCNKEGHIARDCEEVVCSRCREVGHVALACPNDIKRSVCQKSGHSSRLCSLSFANVAKCPTGVHLWVAQPVLVRCATLSLVQRRQRAT
ncbi:ZCCHC3 [Branchiostoma lanceolatum]|uniref:ZCCHC3 protein n=1 Tax=Branchiostoma lanceolatum TaxID=7740 RepID=A0A8J9VCA8_BRALA|nr:ZCCHC3 [Branchiostoma lanceolatum]